MKKKDEGKIEKFKKLENELISLLVEPFEFNDDGDDEEEKRRLKSYIMKVKRAGVVFEKYEAVALEIEKALGEEEKDFELSSSVVDMRENKDQKVMPTKQEYEKQQETLRAKAEEKSKEEYVDEVQMSGARPVVIRKKKRKVRSQSAREM